MRIVIGSWLACRGLKKEIKNASNSFLNDTLDRLRWQQAAFKEQILKDLSQIHMNEIKEELSSRTSSPSFR